MAVTKLWPVRYSLGHVIDYAANPAKTKESYPYSEKEYQALDDVIAYAERGEKTEQKLYVDGINCDPAFARDEFVNVKLQYGKTDGIQAYHGYLSFKEQNITPSLAQQIGMEFARRVWGERFQIVVSTHLNTQHLHCHFVINSVSFRDGKRLHGEEKAWIRFRHIADEICQEYGLYYEAKPEYSKPISYYCYKLEKDGMPTRYSILRETVDEFVSRSRSLSEFRYLLEKNGYRYQFNPNRKYWTITPKGYDKPIRLYKLGENYTNEAILQNLSQIKSLFEKQWENIIGNCDEFLYLGGNEQNTHDYISKMLGKETIDFNTFGVSKGKNSNYTKNYQMIGRRLLTLDEVRMLKNDKAILLIRGERPVLDDKYNLLKHPNIALTADGNKPPYQYGVVRDDVVTVSVQNMRYIVNDDSADDDPDTDYELLSNEELEEELGMI